MSMYNVPAMILMVWMGYNVKVRCCIQKSGTEPQGPSFFLITFFVFDFYQRLVSKFENINQN